MAVSRSVFDVETAGFEADFSYAVFYEDPCGNRLAICHRTAIVSVAGEAMSSPLPP